MNLEENRSLLASPNFPFGNGQKNRFKNVMILGLGGNIGDVSGRFEKSFRWLQNNARFQVIRTSPLYLNPAFGIKEQADFTNAVIVVGTDHSYYEAFKVLRYLEKRFGRQRKKEQRYGPRTLDIDLLFFNALQIRRSNLIIPHPEWKNRESVMIPLSLIEGWE